MSKRTPLSNAQVEALKIKHPELPEDYFDYLQNVGWGEADTGRMVYQSPVPAISVFGERYRGSAILLLGDDFQGYCFGFDLASKRLGEISESGEWQPWPERTTFADYTNGEGPNVV